MSTGTDHLDFLKNWDKSLSRKIILCFQNSSNYFQKFLSLEDYFEMQWGEKTLISLVQNIYRISPVLSQT